jgi:hypothetical protein
MGVEFRLDETGSPASMRLSWLASNGDVFKTHFNAVTFNLKGRPQEGGSVMTVA